MYMKNFGEFYNDQVEHANSIILSRTDGVSEKKLEACVALLREHNQTATIITTPWEKLAGVQILEAMEQKNTLEQELKELEAEARTGHHHEGECDDHHHEEHHHHHDGECGCHHHEEHHHHDGECGCHHHEEAHHHHHDGECGCHHQEHGHHHADEIFTSWGIETTRKFTEEEIGRALEALSDSETYGMVLRAKGIVEGTDGNFLHFDFVPEEKSVRTGSAIVMGRLCVIGSHIKEEALKRLFV